MRRSYKSLYRKMNKGQGKTGKKKLGFLVLILIIAAVAVTVITLFATNTINFSRKGAIVAVSENVNLENAKRNPTVTFKTANGNAYNKLTGVSRDNFSFEQNINTYSPIDSDRKQYISVDVNKDEIKSISYEVRSMADGALMEKTETAFTANGDNTNAQLDIKNLLNPNEKYQLQIRVEYTDNKTLYYDTVIENRGSTYLDEKIAFVNSFSDNIYDASKEKEVFSYLAPQSGVDITNFAVADIFSPTSLVTWNTLNPKKVSRETLSIIAIDDNSTRMTMSYPISVTGSDGKEKRIVVNEAYTVRMMSNGKVNLINYQRRAEETLLPESVTVSSNSLLLGFNYSSNVEGSGSSNGQYTAFKNAGNLWLANKDGKLSEIFTFDVNDSNDSDLNTLIKVDDKGYIQSCSRPYGIHIINVSDDGKVTFAVYGTQMAGEHAGETGIALFKYDGSLREIVFVKSDADLNVLKSQAESSYINDNNLYYIVSGNTMYGIDTESFNSKEVLTDIPNGQFSANSDKSIIAYDGAKNSSGYSTEIKLYNRYKETSNSVTADEGEIVKTLGYIGGDFIYGVADISDIQDNKVYYKKFIILDSDGNEVTTYENEGMRYADPSVNANDLSFDRYNKNGSTYNKIDNNKLIGKNVARSAGYSVAFDSSGSSNTYRKQLYMTFINGLNFSGNADVVKGLKYMNPDTAVLEKE